MKRLDVSAVLASVAKVFLTAGLLVIPNDPQVASAQDARDGFLALDDYYMVDCVLPGQVRRFGQMTQITKPRPARLEAFLCRARGGQYIEYDRSTFESSVRVWKEVAESGDAEAILILGRLLERQGAENPALLFEAFRWYEKGASKGSTQAKLALASLYERGLGVARDEARALTLYREALGLSDEDELFRRSAGDPSDIDSADRGSALALAEAPPQSAPRDVQASAAEQRHAAQAPPAAALEPRASTPSLSDASPSTPQAIAGRTPPPGQSSEPPQAPAPMRSPSAPRAAEPNGPSERVAGAPAPSIIRSPRLASPFQAAGEGGAAPAAVRAGGSYRALIVTVDREGLDYSALSTSLGRELSQRYRFAAEELRNPTGAQLLARMRALREELQPDDSLLVFFAGGATQSPPAGGNVGVTAWQLPGAGSGLERVPHDQVTEYLDTLPARRILLLTTGVFENGIASAPVPRVRTIASPLGGDRGAARRARILIAGDQAESSFLGLIRQNQRVLDAPALWERLAAMAQDEEPPFIGQLLPGSEGGTFVLVPVAPSNLAASQSSASDAFAGVSPLAADPERGSGTGG